MIHSDWIWGFGGGLMIGLAASAYLLMNGKIMGISGIFGGLVDRSGWSDWAQSLHPLRSTKPPKIPEMPMILPFINR